MRVATSSGVPHRLVQIHAPSVGPPPIRLRPIRHRPDSPARRRLIQIHAPHVEPPLIQLRQIHRWPDSPTRRCLVRSPRTAASSRSMPRASGLPRSSCDRSATSPIHARSTRLHRRGALSGPPHPHGPPQMLRCSSHPSSIFPKPPTRGCRLHSVVQL
jgi:hypothetical protein